MDDPPEGQPVGTKPLPPIPQLDHTVDTGPLEVQRKLDPSEHGRLFMAEGQVVEEGSPDQFLENPRLRTQQFLQQVLRLVED